jgi:hypothetical protein
MEGKLYERKKKSINEDIPTVLFSDDQVVVAFIENALQIIVHRLVAVTSK